MGQFKEDPDFVPIKRLYEAVLRGGIEEASGKVSCSTSERSWKPEIIQKAREWIESDDEDVFSFRTCCLVLNMDPEKVRARL